MKNVLASARVIHEYYRLVDSDPEDPNYHRRLHQFTSVATTKFENYYSRDDNPIVSLFQTLISLNQSVHELDDMGLETLADKLDSLKLEVDSNLRAAISRILQVNVESDIPFDKEFVNRIATPGTPVAWLKDYRSRQRKSNR